MTTTTTTMLDWSAADAAHSRLREDYLAFCIALGKLNADGATHEEISERYDMNRPAVTKAIAVGRDPRINVRSANNMPRSSETLYLLTKLDDEQFKLLASPETTRAMLLAPKSPAPKNPKMPTAEQNLLDEIKALKADLAVSEKEVEKYLDRCIEHEETIERLEAENAKLRAEIVELKKSTAAKPAAAKPAAKPAAAKPAAAVKPDAVKPAPKTKPAAVKPAAAKPAAAKPAAAAPVTDRTAKLVELYTRAKAAGLKRDPGFLMPDIGDWLKSVFLAPANLPKDIRDLPSFMTKSVDGKVAFLSDDSFAQVCAAVEAS